MRSFMVCLTKKDATLKRQLRAAYRSRMFKLSSSTFLFAARRDLLKRGTRLSRLLEDSQTAALAMEWTKVDVHQYGSNPALAKWWADQV